MNSMEFISDPELAADLLERFADFLEQGLPYGAAFLAAAWRSKIDPGATLKFMADKFRDGLVPCSALIEPLIAADLVEIVRSGEREGDVISHMRIAAGVSRRASSPNAS
jgi:hypothetical protein